MVADWRENQPKGAKNLPQVEAMNSLGIFPPIRQGFELVMFQQIANQESAEDSAWDLWGTDVDFLKPPSGLGL